MEATEVVTIDVEQHPPKQLSNKQKRKLRQLQSQAQGEAVGTEDATTAIVETNKRFKADNKSSVPRSATKKLLIFDLNHVLLDRTPLTSRFTLRPHVHSFLLEMSQYFTLAIWSSMKKSKHSKQLVREVFRFEDMEPSARVPILFAWFQNHCHAIYPTTETKPVFLKNLSAVWKEYPQFSILNTILVDDSIEKCINNPHYSLLIPKPYYYLPTITTASVTPVVEEELTVLSARFDPVTGTMHETSHTTTYFTLEENHSCPLSPVTEVRDVKSSHESTDSNDGSVPTGTSALEDSELAVDSALRRYLIRLGSYIGSVEDFVTAFQPYRFDQS